MRRRTRRVLFSGVVGFLTGRCRAFTSDRSKRRVENEIKEQLASPKQSLTIESPVDAELAADTAHNRRHRYNKAHALLARFPLARPEKVADAFFRDVLDVDLDDPYLGLAPYVLGGESGRSH